MKIAILAVSMAAILTAINQISIVITYGKEIMAATTAITAITEGER